ncbi:MAG TPA: HAMP domain-containing sensor histidine kinase [Candidatus Ozemobacteraceae bacterium]
MIGPFSGSPPTTEDVVQPLSGEGFRAPSYRFEVLQCVLLLLTFAVGYGVCRLLGCAYGTAPYARILFTIFAGFNIASVFVALQGIKQLPPRSMLKESMANLTISLGCAAMANGLDLALWLGGIAMIKSTFLPNLFFVSALLFGIAGILQMARVCRVPPGIDSAATFFVIVLVYLAIPYLIDPNVFSAGTSGPFNKELVFGLLYAFTIGYMSAIALKIWKDAQGTLRSSARLICLGALFLSFGCAIYGPLFVKHSALEVASHWVHVILALGYYTVGLGIQRMGMTVVEVFSPDQELLSTGRPLVDIFGPVLGMRVYDAMVKRIRESNAALIRIETESQLRKEHIAELEREVKRSTEAEEALRKAMEALETANQSKNHFLSMISHELRTPLTGILAYGQMLSDPNGPLSESTTEEIRELGRRIRKSAGHLQNLIDGILQLSQANASQTVPQIGPFLLSELLDFVVPLAELHAHERNLQFELEVPEKAISLSTDQHQLRQIIINLLLNAFKFTHTGTVTLKIDVSEAALRIEVADTGIGIPPEQQEKIFEPFYQVSTGNTRKFGGAGLGLAIVKRLVTVLDGSITLESEVEKGTRIRIILPDIVIASNQ